MGNTLIVILEMQIKTTVRSLLLHCYHGNIRKSTECVSNDGEKLEHLPIGGGDVQPGSHYENGKFSTR